MASLCLRSPAFVLTGIATCRRGSGRRPAPADALVRRMVGASGRGTHDHRGDSGAPDIRRADVVGCHGVQTREYARAAAPLEPRRDRLDRPRSHAAGEGVPHTFGEQLGPGRSSRAMAIVHIAIFEAMNAIDRRFESYAGHAARRRTGSMDAAIAQAAHDTLVALYPSQTAHCDELLAEDLATMPDGPRKAPASPSAAGRRGDSAAPARRRLGPAGAAGRRRLHPGRRAGRVAAGSDQPDADRAGRGIGATCGRSSRRRCDQFRVPPPPRSGQPRVHRGLQRGASASAATAS